MNDVRACNCVAIGNLKQALDKYGSASCDNYFCSKNEVHAYLRVFLKTSNRHCLNDFVRSPCMLYPLDVKASLL